MNVRLAPSSTPWIVCTAILAGSWIVALGGFFLSPAPSSPVDCPACPACPSPRSSGPSAEPWPGQAVLGASNSAPRQARLEQATATEAEPSDAEALQPQVAAPPMPPVAVTQRGEIVDQVRTSIEADHQRYADRCWTPVARDFPGLSPIGFLLRIQIGTSGREVARGIAPAEPPPSHNDADRDRLLASPRATATSRMLQCLEQQVDLPVAIAPSSHAFDVIVPLQLP